MRKKNDLKMLHTKIKLNLKAIHGTLGCFSLHRCTRYTLFGIEQKKNQLYAFE